MSAITVTDCVYICINGSESYSIVEDSSLYIDQIVGDVRGVQTSFHPL